MATRTTRTRPQLLSVVVRPGSEAAERYAEARVAGFPPEPELNLQYFGGKTIEHLTFTNVYLGGRSAWSVDDMQRIDWALAAAMEDGHLNNVLAQYFDDRRPTTVFKPSRILDGPLPHRVYRDTIEGFAAELERHGALTDFELASSAFCFMLPRGVVLVDGTSDGQQRRRGDDGAVNVALREDEEADSKHGLGGYHGSIHPRRGDALETLYYAVGVYSEGSNGIVAFDDPWKNVCATFYHELCEVRTDPDVEDAIRAGDTAAANDFLGWYSPRGGEVGDIPLEEAAGDVEAVMREVPLVKGGTAPVQLMWSNAVAGPEGPIARRHR